MFAAIRTVAPRSRPDRPRGHPPPDRALRRHLPHRRTRRLLETLSAREREVLVLIAQRDEQRPDRRSALARGGDDQGPRQPPARPSSTCAAASRPSSSPTRRAWSRPARACPTRRPNPALARSRRSVPRARRAAAAPAALRPRARSAQADLGSCGSSASVTARAAAANRAAGPTATRNGSSRTASNRSPARRSDGRPTPRSPGGRVMDTNASLGETSQLPPTKVAAGTPPSAAARHGDPRQPPM